MTSPSTPRRGFLARAGAAIVGVMAAPTLGSAHPGGGPAPDESWLQGLTGKHRQVFDVTAPDSKGLGRVANFLDAYGEAYGLKDAEISAILVAHGGAVPVLLNDAFWARYELGKRNGQVDPSTQAPAARNMWARGSGASVARLQERGVRFVVCMRSIRRLSGELASAAMPADRVRAELLESLLPGVTPVPAAIVATNRAQESGLTYAYVG
jgi:intracellular sulfur oxidation DsrE/DsrF family protein